jgi:hypothetical protein
MRFISVCTAIAVAVAACSSGGEGTPDPLRFATTSLPVGEVNQAYRAPLTATGGVRPYRITLADGALPAGLKLEGASIVGVPTTAGTQAFTLDLSDANLSNRAVRFSITIRPPLVPRLAVLREPAGEGRWRIRVTVDDVRGFRAARIAIRYDADAFRPADDGLQRNPDLGAGVIALTQLSPGEARLDFAAPRAPDAPLELATVVLEGAEPPAVNVIADVRDAENRAYTVRGGVTR